MNAGAAQAARLPIVALSGVTKAYANGTLALAGLNLAVHKGEFLTLLGPSGCGKSTVLRLIAGLSAPTAGAITWESGAIGGGGARDIGFVFQDATLMPWASVAANVALPLELQGLPKPEAAAQVDEALDRVGLSGFRDAYPRELSGGMKMRVSIARALATHPRLILMDEPFAALDEITRFKLNNELIALWRTIDATVVFVTHSVFESVYLSSRIVVMAPRPGRIAAEIAIDAPYPRDDSFRNSADYARHCRIVSDALGAAMQGAA